MLKVNKDIRVIDLFSGIGGLTYGFKSVGLNVVAGIDNDSSCAYGYETSNQTRFILRDINDVTSKDIEELFGGAEIKVLAGCAPCQPYSKLNPRGTTHQKLAPLSKFAALIRSTKPHVVSMENVSGLCNTDKYPIFKEFLATLDDLHYHYDYRVINTADYGVPQNRVRLVLLASRLGPISVPRPTHDTHITLREVIGDLPPISDGEVNIDDPLHYSSKLNDVNLRRIKATPRNGGTQKSWPEELLLECHKKESGKTFSSVYGRMWWDRPGSTITTQCYGLGNGRHGHPDQDRAISLREAARIQTFPDSYIFYDVGFGLKYGEVAKFIGNAIPVRLGEVLGKSILNHIGSKL